MKYCRFGALGLCALCLALAAGRTAADPPAPKQEAELLDAKALAARIDQLIVARLQQLDIKPAPLADDAEFMRRVYLDLTGCIPRVSEAREFLEDRSADKREQLIDRLLKSNEFINHLGNTWRHLLVPPTTNQQFANQGAAQIKAWIENKLRENVPYDKMVHELVTVSLRNDQPGQSNPVSVFYSVNESKPETVASSISRLFLGVRLECAQCHNHPFASWTRQQFWEYAAFFANLQRGGGGKKSKGPAFVRTIKVGETDKMVEARFLDGGAPKWVDDVDSRVQLAEWMLSPSNPYFARTGANRLWGHFFGVGLIDPIDNEPTEENPISHPQLLNELTQQFVAHNFDMNYLMRAILLSKTYQLTSIRTQKNQDEPRTFARMAVRGLTPEQLFDSLAQATGYLEPKLLDGSNPPPDLFGNVSSPRSEFLSKFSSQDKTTETQTSIPQALMLMNGRFVADATSLENSNTLAAVAEAPFLSTARKIETLYLAALARLPRPEESQRLVAYVERGGVNGDSRAALADVFWALLNSSEFLFNY